jgi:uncharacterized damage-inducible protein DinB
MTAKTVTAKTVITLLLQYKAASNSELLLALNAVDDEPHTTEYRIALRVLNHAHLVDRIFATNLQDKHHSYAANWSADTPVLARLAPDIRATDQWYLDFISRASSSDLEELVEFTFTDGKQGRMSREEMLAHVVTHSGYHRGEVGRLLPKIESTAMRDVFAGYLHRSDPSRTQR